MTRSPGLRSACVLLLIAALAASAGCTNTGSTHDIADGGPEDGSDGGSRDRADGGAAACSPSTPGTRSLGTFRAQPGGTAMQPSIVIGGDGNPVVAWVENSEVHVRRWTGTEWVAVGQPIGLPAGAEDQVRPELAVRGDQLALAWALWDPSDEYIHAAVLEGASWRLLGRVGPQPTFSSAPAIAIDVSGAPVVAWDAVEANGDVFIRAARWNGSGWVAMGTRQDNTPGVATAATWPAIAIADDDTAYLGWSEPDLAGAVGSIYVRRFQAGAWHPLDSATSQDALPGNTPAGDPKLAVSESGQLVAAWSERAVGADFAGFAGAWNGASWQVIGSGVQHNQGASTPVSVYDLAVDSTGRAIVAFEESVIHVYRREGQTFEPLSGGRLDTPPGVVGFPDLAVDPCDRVYVAWHQGQNIGREITVTQIDEP